MVDMQFLTDEAISAGMSKAVPLNCDALKFLPAVRDMCAADRCHSYGKNWACPPGCGSIEECAARAGKYNIGVLVQTVGTLEDEYDFESMHQLAVDHKESFEKYVDVLRTRYPDLLPLGAGTCEICKECTYPDNPCRFPQKQFSSMEANGLLVSDVCIQSGLPYYYGKGTLAYTSCILIE